jgi:hypothetical protein
MKLPNKMLGGVATGDTLAVIPCMCIKLDKYWEGPSAIAALVLDENRRLNRKDSSCKKAELSSGDQGSIRPSMRRNSLEPQPTRRRPKAALREGRETTQTQGTRDEQWAIMERIDYERIHPR